MVGSWDAWHCRVRFSPTLISALDGASVILVASAEEDEGGLFGAQQNELTLPNLSSSLSSRILAVGFS